MKLKHSIPSHTRNNIYRVKKNNVDTVQNNSA